MFAVGRPRTSPHRAPGPGPRPGHPCPLDRNAGTRPMCVPPAGLGAGLRPLREGGSGSGGSGPAGLAAPQHAKQVTGQAVTGGLPVTLSSPCQPAQARGSPDSPNGGSASEPASGCPGEPCGPRACGPEAALLIAHRGVPAEAGALATAPEGRSHRFPQDQGRSRDSRSEVVRRSDATPHQLHGHLSPPKEAPQTGGRTQHCPPQATPPASRIPGPALSGVMKSGVKVSPGAEVRAPRVASHGPGPSASPRRLLHRVWCSTAPSRRQNPQARAHCSAPDSRAGCGPRESRPDPPHLGPPPPGALSLPRVRSTPDASPTPIAQADITDSLPAPASGITTDSSTDLCHKLAP